MAFYTYTSAARAARWFSAPRCVGLGDLKVSPWAINNPLALSVCWTLSLLLLYRETLKNAQKQQQQRESCAPLDLLKESCAWRARASLRLSIPQRGPKNLTLQKKNPHSTNSTINCLVTPTFVKFNFTLTFPFG